jgi:hypothetical protein
MVELQAILGLCQTFGVCIILSSGAYFFSKNTSDLVIDPIENMIERVNHITSDPLSAVHDEEERLLIDAIKQGMFGKNSEYFFDEDEDKDDEGDDKVNLMETEILEQTLYKLGALMAIGYGEAGSRLIG